jgi:succinate dehydrogenase (ubiquinone) membrane anchor subunit
MVVHSHIGFDSAVIDYLHPRKFSVIGPMAKWILRALTGAAVWGVYEFNTNDIGQSLSHHTSSPSDSSGPD